MNRRLPTQDGALMTNREIDALVAEKVGQKVCTCDHAKTASPRFNSDNGRCLTCDAPGCPAYSTNPAASKQLRNKMRGLGWLCCIQENLHSFTATYFFPTDTPFDAQRNSPEVTHATEEMAVALAVLAALGVEVPV